MSILAERAGVDYLGVSNVEEGIAVRSAGVKLPVLVMMPGLKEEAREIVRYNLTPAITNLKQALALNEEAVKKSKTVSVQINVDTGMGRSGVPKVEIISFCQKLQNYDALKVEGIFSHLSSAHLRGKAHDNYTERQISSFTEILVELKKKNMRPEICHISASDAFIWFEESYFTMVRLGELVYGHNSALNQQFDINIKPAMTVKSRIIEIREVEAGTFIGYGRTYRTRDRARIALLPLGYAGGLDYRLSSKGEVIVRGQRASVVGEINMMETMIDVTGIKGVSPGDEVIILGEELTADEMAGWADLYACGIIVSFSDLQHIYTDNEAL